MLLCAAVVLVPLIAFPHTLYDLFTTFPMQPPIHLSKYSVVLFSKWLLSLHCATALAIYLTDRTVTTYRHYHSRIILSRLHLILRKLTNKRRDN
jgi:hypothetical protein